MRRLFLSLNLVTLIAAMAPSAHGRQSSEIVDPLRGKVVAWTLDSGPTRGVSYEHKFNNDGTVEWRVLDGPAKGHSAREKAYSATKVTDEVIALSYLAASGHTLTIVLNVATLRLYGFASGKEEWQALSGSFKIVE